MPSTQLDKAIVIVGFGRGIGKALGFHAAALGARVVVNDIDVHAAITVAISSGDAGHLAVAQAKQWG